MQSKRRRGSRSWGRMGLILALVSSLVIQTACMQKDNNPAAQSTKTKNKVAKSASPNVNAQSQSQNKLPLISQNGVRYVNAKQLVDLLGFHSEWDAESASLMIGDKDPNFVLKINSREAKREGEAIQLASAPIIVDKSAYIPVSALSDLFQQDMSFVVNDNQLIVQGKAKESNFSIKSVDDQTNDKVNGDYLDFGDDPSDPNKSVSEAASAALTGHLPVMKGLKEDESIAALANANIPLLIRQSKQYLGVKYIFGAKPYPQSGGFDCSSYTQYLFAKHGVSLNRLARDQANQGIVVGRKSLRVGDLLFFNVPGRFKSSSAVGHVGIYLGNNTMINADVRPKNGVQITNINKSYWKSVYLFAKRVAS